MAKQINVCVCWQGSPSQSVRDDRVYCMTYSRFISSQEMKSYRISWDARYYYDTSANQLVDFEHEMESIETLNTTLRTLAEDDDFIRIVGGKPYRGII